MRQPTRGPNDPRLERLAEQVRCELGLGIKDRLEPHALAERYGITLATTSQMAREAGLNLADEVLREVDVPGILPATLVRGERRLILVGDAWSAVQVRYNLTHELAHVMLEHPAVTRSPEGGIVRWRPRQEAQSDWLAGAMLVPRRALTGGWAASELACRYGVDERVVRLRNRGLVGESDDVDDLLRGSDSPSRRLGPPHIEWG